MNTCKIETYIYTHIFQKWKTIECFRGIYFRNKKVSNWVRCYTYTGKPDSWSKPDKHFAHFPQFCDTPIKEANKAEDRVVF